MIVYEYRRKLKYISNSQTSVTFHIRHVHDYRRYDSLKVKFHVFSSVRKKLQLPIEQPYRNAYVSRGYNICLN